MLKNAKKLTKNGTFYKIIWKKCIKIISKLKIKNIIKINFRSKKSFLKNILRAHIKLCGGGKVVLNC